MENSGPLMFTILAPMKPAPFVAKGRPLTWNDVVDAR
jgi:hypothetical protein